MKKRFLALFLCCVMVFTLLPAALTTAFATGEADGEPSAPAQETTDVVPGDTGDLDVQPDGEQDEQDEPPAVCTCGAAEGAAHAEDCPLYVNPEQPDDEQDKQDEQPVACTCNAAEGAAHAEDCPLYVAPEQPDDEQDKQDEPPVATKLVDSTALTALFERLMAAETMEEFEAIIEETPEEQLKALTEEQVAQVEAHADSLMPEPLPPIDVTPSEPPVQSEVYRPTVNYTNVAPFGAPVTGGHR